MSICVGARVYVCARVCVYMCGYLVVLASLRLGQKSFAEQPSVLRELVNDRALTCMSLWESMAGNYTLAAKVTNHATFICMAAYKLGPHSLRPRIRDLATHSLAWGPTALKPPVSGIWGCDIRLHGRLQLRGPTVRPRIRDLATHSFA